MNNFSSAFLIAFLMFTGIVQATQPLDGQSDTCRSFVSSFDGDENDFPDLSYQTPNKAKRSKITAGSETKTIALKDIYDFEKRIVDQFKAAREDVRQTKIESRDTLGVCFEQLLDASPLKTRYIKVVRDNHVFFVPNVFPDLDDTQVARLQEGKCFVSPNKGRSFNGHHVEMRDPSEDSCCPVIYMTATTHKSYSSVWHLSKDLRGPSQVSRNKFKAAKRKAVQALADRTNQDN